AARMAPRPARGDALAMTSLSPAQHSPSLAARIGRWSTRHRRLAIAGWLAFVIAALAIATAVGTVTPNQDGSQHGDSATADRILDDAYPDQASESVLVQAKAGSKMTARSPEVRAT